MKLSGVALCALLPLVVPALGCDITPGPRSSWEERIADAEFVFVGQVQGVSIFPIEEWGQRVGFAVERWIKGHDKAPIGIGGEGFFEARQGINSCLASFRGGQRVIFAGKLLPNDAGQFVVYAEDTGRMDPTIFLSDPPTPEQRAQLDYLTTIAEDSLVARPAAVDGE